ncbi:MAG TPA: hypothetical protein VH723_00445 [Candidatus Limnocylindrales bacterium]
MTAHPPAVRRAQRLLLLATVTSMLAALLPPAAVAAPRPSEVTAPGPAALVSPTNHLTLSVRSLDASNQLAAPIGEYRWLISLDDTGNPSQAAAMCAADTNPDYPAGCDWPSAHAFTGGAGGTDNLVTQGDQTDLNVDVGFDLPDGKYLISVMAEDHKIDGAWFTMPMEAPGLVAVGLHPDPLPLSTIRIQVFEDTVTNGQYDQTEHGLAGFKAHVADVLAEVTTDWFGNPICGEYEGVPAGDNYIPGTGGECVSDADGYITIPNLGSNRYSVQVVPPTGSNWIQTSTLEGSHDWDVWAYEGYQGYERELVVNGALTPVAWFGYVRPMSTLAGGSGRITGHVISTKSYLPPAGGDTTEGDVPRAVIALTDLGVADDALVYVGRANASGHFDIANVPDSTYQLAIWDVNQDLLLGITKAVVDGGAVTDIGDFALSHWFSKVSGYVFIDNGGNGASFNPDNKANGRKDPGEPPLVGQSLVLKSRDNSLVDAGSAVATTDTRGYYEFTEVYPYGYWTVLENYNDRYYTTGVTYQADTAPAATRLGAGVDVSMFNMDGIPNRVDWGVLPYAPGSNGGIVGSVVYNLTRNELDARLAATEDYEPGIPGLTVNLYAPIACPDADAQCTADRQWLLASDGSVAKGTLLNTYITEEFLRPTDCQYRNANGDPQPHYTFMAAPTGGHECVEAPLMGGQIKTGPSESAPPAESEFSLVNGNYGFGDGCFETGYDRDQGACFDGPDADALADDPTALTAGDYLVEVVSPQDDVLHRPKYKVTREEDVNVFGGDQFAPAVPPHPCAGAMHTVDVLGIGPDDPATGTHNPSFVEAGGSPFEGQQMPLCDVRLVNLGDQRSTAPGFSFFTDVPQPGRLVGAVVQDLALGTNPREFYYGEKAGVPNSPIGVYDYNDRLVRTIQTDPNGFFEILLPSTRTFNCPLPAGPCPNVYRLVGNDPGQPSSPNPNHTSQYRTMETIWQIWPGLTLLADIALLPASPVIEFPGVQGTQPPDCDVEPTRPEVFRVSVPYVSGSGDFSIEGQRFGDAPGEVTLDGIVIPTNAWTDRHIDVTVPPGTPPGAHQLMVTASSGLMTITGLTFHVLGGLYTPSVWDVGPAGVGMEASSIQDGIEMAVADPGDDLVVVWPNTPGAYTPLGDYYENIVIHSPIKLQGVGPGGVRADGSFELGSIINGIGFATVRETEWDAFVRHLQSTEGWAGNQVISEGAGIYVVAGATEFTSAYKASIDGLRITGADSLQAGEGERRLPLNPVQAGGVFVNAYARHLQVTNNLIEGNGGAFAAAIRVGTPFDGDAHNDGLRIAHNRIVANGATNLAGAIGLFSGTNGYELDHNDICGNFSAEYGGAISHFGLSSPVSSIHHNRIWFNGSYDEGAGILIAGELPDAGELSPGSGPVDVYANAIQANLANDDGGGIRLLMAGNFPINIYNNFIVNNVSTHEGGGIALDDSTNVRFFNNTVARNLTTATAQDARLDPGTGNTLPDPAGLSDAPTSDLLQATLPPGHETFSDPLLFNNIFWDNRSGHYDSAANKVLGLGLYPAPGDDDIDSWDLGVVGPGLLEPTFSILQTTQGTQPDSSNQVGIDPQLAALYPLQVATLGWRAGGGQTAFIFVHLVTDDAPPGSLGDYHMTPGISPARDAGTSTKAGVTAPTTDIDDDTRPLGGFDVGADEDLSPPIDLSGPVVETLTLTPDRTSTSVGVAISADATDATTGHSNVDAGEYFIDAVGADGSGTALAVGTPAVDATLTGTIFSVLSEGAHTIYVHAHDAAGNWGPAASVTLVIDQTGPETTSLAVDPSPTGGAAFVTVSGTASDASRGGSTIASSEWFIETDPGEGLAAPLAATDLAFDEVTEAVSTTIDVSGLGVGTHTLTVRSRDAAGNWGPESTVDFAVSEAEAPDVAGPVVSLTNIAPAGSLPAGFIGLRATASDAAAGSAPIAEAEWFEGIDPGLGNGRVLLATDGAFDEVTEPVRATVRTAGWRQGPHVVRIRARDARGNWGPTALLTVVIDASPNIVANALVIDDFSAGNVAVWSRIVGPQFLTLSAAAGMDGSPGVALRLVRGTTAFLQDASPVAARQYHVRFRFDPHGSNTGTGRQVLFQGRNATGTAIFQLEFRHPRGGAYQVREVLRRSTGLVRGPWITIPNRAVTLELSWSSATAGSLRLYVNGVRRTTLTGNTSSLRLEAVRIGNIVPLAGGSGTEYIDGYVSSLTTFIGS